jgi:uncharacterized protein (TIGR03083 family)
MAGSRSGGLWDRVSRNRCRLADDFAALTREEFNAQSWCPGWRVQDVLAHLVQNAEASRGSVVRDLFKYGLRPDHVVLRLAQELCTQPVAELCQRLRSASNGRYHFPGTPPTLILGEVLVHGADVFGPLDSEDPLLREDANEVLSSYWRWGRIAFHTRGYNKVQLVATDGRWTAGSGPEVRGSTVDLMLLLANRRQIMDRLSGPGLSRLKTGAPRG